MPVTTTNKRIFGLNQHYRQVLNSKLIFAPRGELIVTTGAVDWTVPIGVNSINIVAIGAGAGGTSSTGGGGGALVYKNSIPVTPGQVIPISIGATGASGGATSVGSLLTAAGANGATGGVRSGGDGGGNGGNGGVYSNGYGGGGGATGRYNATGGFGAYGSSRQVPQTTYYTYGQENWRSTTSYPTYQGGGWIEGNSTTVGSYYMEYTYTGADNWPNGPFNYNVVNKVVVQGSTTSYVTEYFGVAPTGTSGQGAGGTANIRGEGIDLYGSNFTPPNNGYGFGGGRNGVGGGGAVRIIWGTGLNFPNNATL